jgi:hypothetical protein
MTDPQPPALSSGQSFTITVPLTMTVDSVELSDNTTGKAVRVPISPAVRDERHVCVYPVDPSPDAGDWTCPDCGQVYEVHVDTWYEPRED